MKDILAFLMKWCILDKKIIAYLPHIAGASALREAVCIL